jgi:hypothetical protein
MTKPALFLAMLESEGVPTPTLEHRFAKSLKRQWRFDLCWPEYMIALEVEGAIWTQGRHTRGKGYEADCLKYSTAAILGWRVLRVTYGMIERGEATDLVKRALSAAQAHVSPAVEVDTVGTTRAARRRSA